MRRENLTGLRAIMLAAILIIMISAAEEAVVTASASTPLQERIQQEAERVERRQLWEQYQPGAQYTEQQQTDERIVRLLGNDPSRINDPQWLRVATDILRTENMTNALLVIHSNTGWSAVVQDSNFVQESVDGFGSRSIEFECSPFGIFSHVVQKSTDHGVLNVYVAQNGHIVKQANTGAAYGVVSIAGNCA